MAFVGRLSNLFTSVQSFYNELNPATLSGAVDIVVVQQPDGELACSPFHVRFGKLSLLMPQEKKVVIKVNDSEIAYPMKLGEAGEAFFVFETEHEVPEEFQTSPLMQAADTSKLGSSNEEPPYLDIGGSKDDTTHQQATTTETEKDDFDDHEQKDKLRIPAELQSPKMIIEEQMDKVVTKVDPYHKMEHLEHETAKLSLDDEKTRPQHDTYPMGDGSVLLERVMPDEAVTSTTIAKETFIVRPANGDINSKWMDVTHIREDENTLPQDTTKRPETAHGHAEHESIVLDIAGYKTENEPHPSRPVTPRPEKEQLQLGSSPPPASSSLEKESSSGNNDSTQPAHVVELASNKGPNKNENDTTRLEKDDSSNKDATLDTKLQLEPGAIYRVEMSLCGLSSFGREEKENGNIFNEQQITYSDFVHNPNILNDRRLVFRYKGRYFGATRKGPLFISLFLFHEPLDQEKKDELQNQEEAGDEADSRESYLFGRGWRQWWSRSSVTDTGGGGGDGVTQDESLGNKDDETTTRFTTMTMTTSVGWNVDQEGEQNGSVFPAPHKNYAKTLRLTSDQLKTLGLKKGSNTITYEVSSEYQGTAICTAKIFYWDYDIQIVISDIDGTITKSDALGHVFTMIGKDWTHNGVAKLYTDILNNGYHILYLTSRAIGQADYTRDYLRRVEQDKHQLPEGPVIMSPDRLFTSFHREVIMRKPEVFKMACLRDILRLFGGHNPFYAGFGNRITDAISYRSVNVPASRIFTIDPNGDVKLELLLGFLSSYIHLNDLVDQIFPPINRAITEEFSDWNYWKQPLPEINIPELNEDAPPTPTSPKPVPIKPDPSAALPSETVVESDAQKRKQRGILRSFTSRSNSTDTSSSRLAAMGTYSSSSPSLLSYRRMSTSSGGRTSPDSMRGADLSETPHSPDNGLLSSSPPLASSPPTSGRVSPAPSSASSSSSLVNKMFTGSLGGVRNTLSRTFATRKSSLSETYNTTLPNDDDDDVEDPSATTTTTTSDNKKEGKKGNEPEFKFDMEDEEDIDMDSIPFI
ncbi:hypothetical protein O0I10_003083 [Lichtheimia ornata]|uniref:phosphatidate phosphatase n=1 Tax=Lichtheimia ornata TaxID=688661 RepID=A0AAD7V9Z0_9FUNG|nr:uncharacterized protein O0I10_003083 [Lichtheimia ornata]KAJ8661333.1 hypothetical protein O0I10_003083 [Lichtheimia ornata]